jgi:ABC-type uncharacterized transport system auxiliary subunit
MKSMFIRASCVAAGATLALLTGCASTEAAKHTQHHAQPDATDPKAMCDMHKKMMSEKTPEQRKAMKEEHMKSMSPDMQNKHKAMMEKCL